MTVTPLRRDQDCRLKNREPDVPAPWFLDPGGWSKTAAVRLYFIFPGICTLSLFIYMVYYIDRLLYVEPSLHLWDKAYLVMVDNVFDVFLDCYISNFISDFINLDALSLCLLRKFHGVLRRSRKMGPVFVSIVLTRVFLLVGKIFFNDFVKYVFCAFELVFIFFYSYY
ncbi:hypothetical protein STEG23_029694 [Scotinomys teguina]